MRRIRISIYMLLCPAFKINYSYENIHFWENDIEEDYFYIIHSASYFEKKSRDVKPETYITR